MVSNSQFSRYGLLRHFTSLQGIYVLYVIIQYICYTVVTTEIIINIGVKMEKENNLIDDLKKENENLKLENRIIRDMIKDDNELIGKFEIAIIVLSAVLGIAIILLVLSVMR